MKVWFTCDAAPCVSDIEKFPVDSPLRKKVYRIFFEKPYVLPYTDSHYKEGDYEGVVKYESWGIEDEGIYCTRFIRGQVIDESEIPKGLDVTYENSPMEAEINLILK